MLVIIEKATTVGLMIRGVSDWPVWESPVDSFEWEYSETETAYILEGRVRIESLDGSESIECRKGDLVTFPRGLKCRWQVLDPLRKQYRIEARTL